MIYEDQYSLLDPPVKSTAQEDTTNDAKNTRIYTYKEYFTRKNFDIDMQYKNFALINKKSIINFSTLEEQKEQEEREAEREILLACAKKLNW